MSWFYDQCHNDQEESDVLVHPSQLGHITPSLCPKYRSS